MIAIDTNVPVRFLIHDDISPFEVARDIINSCSAKRPAFICIEVLAELVWVLVRSYKYSRNEITAAVIGLISAGDLHLERFKVLQSSYPFTRVKVLGFPI